MMDAFDDDAKKFTYILQSTYVVENHWEFQNLMS